ncbi:MAG: queuosine precursor transporter [Candidatus Competibacteraceae bacterium]|nr:queuosine precursor transporter [Candidatus Competibacteraceae bacterium]MCB1821699.1 queuosine precursor transporter [Candidatus Competibacteraceae bacterium]
MVSGSPSLASGYSMAFVMIVAGFVTSLLVANIIAVKLIEIGPWIMPAGVIIFPVSYILGDVLTEVYGYHRARQVIWLGFVCNLLAVLAIFLAQILPHPGFWDGQAAFGRILGYAPRLLLASFLAYLVGEFVNAYVLARMKILTQGRWLWTRTIGSTVVGQLLDSSVFIAVAFAGILPQEALITAIGVQWLVKCAYEAAATPVTYGVVGFLKRHEGVDVYDAGTNFNPLKVGN